MCLALYVKYLIFLSGLNEAFNFLDIFSRGSRVVLCRRKNGLADRHNEAISRFTQFRERAQCISTILTVLRTNDNDVHT